jgi:hypothetical protein
MVIFDQGSENILSISSDGFLGGQEYRFYSTPNDINTIAIVYENKGFNCKVDTNVDLINYNGVDYQGGKKGETYFLTKQ